MGSSSRTFCTCHLHSVVSGQPVSLSPTPSLGCSGVKMGYTCTDKPYQSGLTVTTGPTAASLTLLKAQTQLTTTSSLLTPPPAASRIPHPRPTSSPANSATRTATSAIRTSGAATTLLRPTRAPTETASTRSGAASMPCSGMMSTSRYGTLLGAISPPTLGARSPTLRDGACHRLCSEARGAMWTITSKT